MILFCRCCFVAALWRQPLVAHLLRRAFFIARGWRKGHGGRRWPHAAPSSHSALESCDSLHAAPCAHAPFAKCLHDLLGALELRRPCLPSPPLLGLGPVTLRSCIGARQGPRLPSPLFACSGAAAAEAGATRSGPAAAAGGPSRASIESHATAPQPHPSRPPPEGRVGAPIPTPPSPLSRAAPAPAPARTPAADAALLALPESPKRAPHNGVRSSGRECCCSAEAMVAANPAT